VVRRSKLAMEPFLLRHWTAPIWPRRTDRWPVHAQLWITDAAENLYRLPMADNRCWRSLFGETLLQRGLREPVGAQAISFPPRSRRVQSHRSSANPPSASALRCVSRAAIRHRGLKAARVRTDPCTAGNVLWQSPRLALMWRGCSRRCRPEIGYELICASQVRRRAWISGPAGDESTDRFHAIEGHTWAHG
jgi:hypothetical protein